MSTSQGNGLWTEKMRQERPEVDDVSQFLADAHLTLSLSRKSLGSFWHPAFPESGHHNSIWWEGHFAHVPRVRGSIHLWASSSSSWDVSNPQNEQCPLSNFWWLAVASHLERWERYGWVRGRKGEGWGQERGGHHDNIQHPFPLPLSFSSTSLLLLLLSLYNKQFLRMSHSF